MLTVLAYIWKARRKISFCNAFIDFQCKILWINNNKVLKGLEWSERNWCLQPYLCSYTDPQTDENPLEYDKYNAEDNKLKIEIQVRSVVGTLKKKKEKNFRYKGKGVFMLTVTLDLRLKRCHVQRYYVVSFLLWISTGENGFIVL